MKQDLAMLIEAHKLLGNLFDMGYQYAGSINTLDSLAEDIRQLKILIEESSEAVVLAN